MLIDALTNQCKLSQM
uniref:Uncharacterized protein n=1 Tax=Rhizophora mucronata TaxID=61149 RepID=A0A2P2R3U5_RHIMU